MRPAASYPIMPLSPLPFYPLLPPLLTDARSCAMARPAVALPARTALGHCPAAPPRTRHRRPLRLSGGGASRPACLRHRRRTTTPSAARRLHRTSRARAPTRPCLLPTSSACGSPAPAPCLGAPPLRVPPASAPRPTRARLCSACRARGALPRRIARVLPHRAIFPRSRPSPARLDARGRQAPIHAPRTPTPLASDHESVRCRPGPSASQSGASAHLQRACA